MDVFYDYKIINKIYSENNYNIYQAIHQSEQNSVLIKIINTQFSDLKTIDCLKNEYEILKSLTFPGVIKAYALENYNNNLGLVLEYFEGEYLEHFLHNKELSQNDFFVIAIQVVNILQEIHSHQIIHQNIQPSSIVINPETLEVKISNFSRATSFNTNNNISSKELEALNIAYISPEQTGRVNLSLDYRTDFYSLGIVFYQILTGKLPYDQALNYLELIHCHLAQTPASPHQINSDISQPLSSIIMKLLAKNPEDRYQNAYGIKKDLEICQTQYQNQGKIELFDIGTLDRCSQFIISPQLYNRCSEVNTITTSWDRVILGAVEMVVVTGNSGMGKTSMILEVIQPIVKQKGYFTNGEFEQLTSTIPYSGIIRAFRDLVLQLLTEPSKQLKIWREKILSVLGTNGTVITNILPELELIIGSQPDIPELPVKETENRFNIVLEKFIKVFLKPEHPLVLFLDNLQWIDSASLKLLELLLDNSNSEYLLVIAAYRDNEVNSDHPLIDSIENIQKKININHINPQPLILEDVNQLLVDTLLCQEERSLPLAKLLFERTYGNPWFIHQLLKALYVEKFLIFDFSSWSWCWEIEKIMTTPILSYSVSELVIKNLEKLS
nr:AAA family ATPase [Xenococcaceae cyanobacterium MO_167.B52]